MSTKIGAEGLDIEDNKNILLADNPEKFASKIIGLLKNPDILKETAEKGYDLVRKKYDWKTISENVRKLLDT